MKFITEYIKEGFFDNTGVTSAVSDKKKAQELEKVLLKTFVPEHKIHVGTKGWYPIHRLNDIENKSFCKYLSENFNRDEGFELDIIKMNCDKEELFHVKFTRSYGSTTWNVYTKHGWNVYENYGLISILDMGPIVKGSVKLAKEED